MPRGNGGVIGPANIPTTASAKGVWSLVEQMIAKSQGIWPPSVLPDPYFDYTTLLLPGNGTNGAQNNTFLDSSTNNFTITRNGNTTQGTFSPFSQTGWGNYFDGSADYCRIASAQTGLQFGTGDFTVEGWVFSTNGTGTYQHVLTGGTSWASGSGGIFWYYNSGSPQIGAAWNQVATNPALNSGTLATNTWHHFAVVRSVNTLTLYVNGTSVDTLDVTGISLAVNNQSQTNIGGGGWDQDYAGYLSNLRVVKGTAVYTSNFTPPTAPLTAISGTSLLTCQSNRFVDNSASPLTITVNGSPSVQAFSPFNPSASWSAATYGGSGYFDGTGDYLSCGSASDWTFMSNTTALWSVEMWIYTSVSGTNQIILDNYNLNSAAIGVNVYKDTSNAIRVNIARGVGGSPVVSFTSTGTLVINAWNHILITYDQSLASQNLKVYLNGGSAETATKNAVTPSSSDPPFALTVGRYANASGDNVNGYIGSLRISNVVRSPGVPTSPYTNDSNTKLLLNYTNAGIYDATSKNDLETVDGAKISTAQSKWGGSSMAFDGTGDYLNGFNNGVLFYLDTTYTIEFWVRLNTVSGTQNFVILSAANNSNQGINFYTVGTTVTVNDGNSAGTGPSGGTLAANTWYYLALVANGTNTKLFIDGNLISTYAGITRYTAAGAWKYITIGVDGGKTASYLNGYINDLRITNSIARYTANFTPPTAAFPTL
jgi:hypothetical protein